MSPVGGTYTGAPFVSLASVTTGATIRYTRDARNQLVAITAGTHRTEFTYDGLQRRVRSIEKESGAVQSDTRFIWCESQICEERAADGVTVIRRVFAQGEQVNGAAHFFSTDHLGSVREVTDASGSLLARYSFDPWGRRSLESGADVTNVGFTGHRWQLNGSGWLSQYRFFDPNTARWTSEDPLRTRDGLNLYRYVANNPVRTVDPDGRLAAVGAIAIPWELEVPGIVIALPEIALVATAAVLISVAALVRQNDCAGKWTCMASGHMTPIFGQAPPDAQGSIVRQIGYGDTRPQAAQAAMDMVQASSPRGYYVRHIQVVWCKRGR